MSATKTVLDCTAGVVAFVSVAATTVEVVSNWLPVLAALLSVIWLGLRFYEYARWVRRGRKGKLL